MMPNINTNFNSNIAATICLTQLRKRCALAVKIAKEENAMKIIPTGGDPAKVLNKDIIMKVLFVLQS